MDEGNQKTKRQKEKRILGIILVALSIIYFVAAAIEMYGKGGGRAAVEEEPIDIYQASETDEYVFTYIQYMTDPVAYYEVMESMQFYITMDNDWNPVVVCIHNDDMETYQPYIDWLYSESYENEPEEIEVYGYAQPYDAELMPWIIEGYNVLVDEEIVDESNFEEYFGEYFMLIGQKSEVYKDATFGIISLLVAIVMLVIGGVFVYGSPKIQTENAGPIIEGDSNIALGILGALGGATLGSLLWIIVGLLGYISGWVAIIMMIFAYYGYQLLGHKKDGKGLVISLVACLIMILPATYLTWSWEYYRVINEDLVGYSSFGRAIVGLPGVLTSNELWGNFAGNIIMGYVFAGIMGIQWFRSKRNET